MKKIIAYVTAACLLAGLTACGNPPPDKMFAQVVLNANLIFGFAGSGMERELESPSVKLVDAKTNATAPMTRAEVVKMKLDSIQENFGKVKSLSSNDDNKEMLAAAVALYQLVIPVYQNEYTQLANLYDTGAPAAKIEEMNKSIKAQYGAKFLELHRTLLTAGKAFAARHNIKVQEVNTSPGGRY